MVYDWEIPTYLDILSYIHHAYKIFLSTGRIWYCLLCFRNNRYPKLGQSKLLTEINANIVTKNFLFLWRKNVKHFWNLISHFFLFMLVHRFKFVSFVPFTIISHPHALIFSPHWASFTINSPHFEHHLPWYFEMNAAVSD